MNTSWDFRTGVLLLREGKFDLILALSPQSGCELVESMPVSSS